MKWAVLCVVLVGAILYLFGALTPSPDKPSILPSSAALEPPSRGDQLHPTDPTAPPLPQEIVPDAAFNGDPAESDISTESPLSESHSLNAAPPSNNAEQTKDTWGQLLRGAPVHGGPSVSSPKLGYASAGAEMRLLERKLGWVRIMDPATSREGWIYEEHVTVKEEPSGIANGDSYQEAAIASGADSATQKPKRSFKTKKSRKNYAKKRWRKRFGWRFRHF
jgi:Bacterial SH3 domain